MIARLFPISFTFLLLAISSVGAQESLWTFRAGAVILKRESPQTAFPGGIDFGVFDFDFEGGVEANLIRQLQNGHDLELRYFGVGQWSARANFVGPPATGDYTSSLNSTEINLWHPHDDRLTLMVGFRWVELHDELAIVPVGEVSNVDNHMYGFQIGARRTLWDHGGPLLIGAGLKAGIYHNAADADTSVPDFPGLSAREDHTSFLGELDITGSLLLTDHCALRAGYQFLWIDGVAEAAQATCIQGGNNLDMSSTAFYHGAFIGLEVIH